mmetsp:Transcript_39248/g.125999  ORF Transcript_39248/g.125999 Transcript_39248/m.125999 type:complete len:215 (-) Transcript_39248:1669-2313(-)
MNHLVKYSWVCIRDYVHRNASSRHLSGCLPPPPPRFVAPPPPRFPAPAFMRSPFFDFFANGFFAAPSSPASAPGDLEGLPPCLFAANLPVFVPLLMTFNFLPPALPLATPSVASSRRSLPPKPPSCLAKPRNLFAFFMASLASPVAYTTSVRSRYFMPFNTGEPSCSSGTPVSPCGKTVAEPTLGRTGRASSVPSAPALGTKKVVSPPSKSSFK